MKAIVLSCDKYHAMAEHMILNYQTLWPDNQLTFRIPWNEKCPNHIQDRFGEKVELIQTGLKFKDTFSGLTSDLNDNDWVYWCIDDKYPIDIDPQKAQQVFDFVQSIQDPNIINTCFHFVRGIRNSAEYMQREKIGLNLFFDNLKFIEHNGYINHWLHQFFRVKALREFWSKMKEPKQYQARPMDEHLELLTGTYLTLDHNICKYGESTTKGIITNNCFESFQNLNMQVPAHFLRGKRRTVII